MNEKVHRAKEIEFMEICFDSYAENGFASVQIKLSQKLAAVVVQARISILTISMTLLFSPPNTVWARWKMSLWRKLHLCGGLVAVY